MLETLDVPKLCRPDADHAPKRDEDRHDVGDDELIHDKASAVSLSAIRPRLRANLPSSWC